MLLLYHEIHDCQGQNQDNLTPLDKRDQAWYDKSMDKVKLITLVIKKASDGIYEHHMMPGNARITCTSAASSGYISGVLHVIKAIRRFETIALAMVTPWDDDAGTYEVCVIVPSVAIGQDFESVLRQKGFWVQKWPGECEFSKIIHESEIPSVLESLESIKEQ